MTRIIHVTRAIVAAGALIASAGYAETTDQPAAAQPAAESPFGAGEAVETAVLGSIAGREDIAQSINAQNTATVSRNSVSGNSVTGGIAFDAQAFQNMNGLSVLSANTGNNVAINSSLNVNVTMHP